MSENEVVYAVDIETANLIENGRKARAELKSLGDAVSDTAPGFNKLSSGAKNVSSALAMPEVNKLSAKLAQLSGKIGTSSESALNAAVSQNKFSGALSTVAGQMGAGYVSNIGSATNSLIKHAKEAIAATSAQLDNAVAVQKESLALQESASQLVVTAAAEKKLAEAATKTAAAELQAAEAAFTRKQADIESLEAMLMRQKESLRQSEANLQITDSEKAVKDAIQARNAVEATQAKILKQSNQAVKEVTAAEGKAKAAKVAAVAASEKLTQSMALEATAVATVAKANEAAALAVDKVTIAAKAQAVAVTGARNALALLGGPSGILLLAAAGVYSLYQAMSNKSAVDEYKINIDSLITKLEFLTRKQAEAATAETKIQIKTDTKSLDEARDKLASANSEFIESQRLWKAGSSQITDAADRVKIASDTVEHFAAKVKEGQARLSKFTKQAETAGDTTRGMSTANEIYEKTMGNVISSNKTLAVAINQTLSAAEEDAALRTLKKALEDAGATAEETEAQVTKLRDSFAEKRALTLEADLKRIEEQTAALRIEMVEGKEAAVKYLASIDAVNKGYSGAGAEAYTTAIVNQYREQEKLTASHKKVKSASDSVGKGLEKQQSQAASLRKEYELLTTGTEDVARSMAIFNAVQALGTKATEKQKAAAAAEAAEMFDLKQKIDDFRTAAEITPELKISKAFADEAAELQRLFSIGLIDPETFKELGAKAKAKFDEGMAETKAAGAVTPQQELAAKVDPVQALANENAQKLALIQELANQEVITEQNKIALMNAANVEYEDQRMAAQWELLSQQSLGYELLTGAIDSFGTSASGALSGVITGTQSASDAMRSLANTVLNSVIQTFIDMGLQQVKSAIMGATAQQTAIAATTTAQVAGIATQTAASTSAAVATTAAWTPAAIVASISSFGGAVAIGLAAIAGVTAISGARKNGGPVSAGSMYRVGEGGLPEIFQASNGNQYMIPGDNGSVISNKDINSGESGGSAPTIIINNYSTATIDAQATQDSSGAWTVEAFVADLNNGGTASQAITSNFNVKRQPRGQS